LFQTPALQIPARFLCAPCVSDTGGEGDDAAAHARVEDKLELLEVIGRSALLARVCGRGQAPGRGRRIAGVDVGGHAGVAGPDPHVDAGVVDAEGEDGAAGVVEAGAKGSLGFRAEGAWRERGQPGSALSGSTQTHSLRCCSRTSLRLGVRSCAGV
jgi:hypothetical protein